MLKKKFLLLKMGIDYYNDIISSIKTRHSIEHCTLHADGARQHFTMAYLIDFRMIKSYLVPLCWQNMEEEAFHFNLQQPINLKWYECKTSLRLKCAKTYLYLFDILAIATNGKPLLKLSSLIIPQFFSDFACCLVCQRRL